MNEARKSVQAEFLRNVERIKGFIFALIPDINAVEDLSQETFITAVEKSQDFTPGTDFLAWVRAIARIKVLNYFKSSGRHTAVLKKAAVERVCRLADSGGSDWRVHRAALKHCLDQTAPKAREIIEFRYLKNLMPQAIAERTGRSVQGISAALGKVRAFLRDCVQRRLQSEGQRI